jgi:O-antigen ligase
VFLFLTLFIAFELLFFGGVLPWTWLAATALCAVAAAVAVGVRALAGKRLDLGFAAAALAVAAGGYFLIGPKFAGSVFAGVWAWAAARNRPKRITLFLHALLAIGLLEALLGVTQRFVSPGWIPPWDFHNTTSAVSGTLINRNHYAGLMEMLTFVPFGLAYAGSRKGEIARPYLYLWASGFMALALVCSLSRMGVAAFVAAAFFVTILIRAGSREGHLGPALGFGLLGLVSAGAVWLGVDALLSRYATVIDSDGTVNEIRFVIARDTSRLIAANPWGVGAGNYQDAFRRYQTTNLDLLFDHAHNDYLETAAEWGVVPAVLFWGFIAVLVGRAVLLFRSSDSFRVRGILLASLGGVFALLVHSAADFNLQIPSNATLFFVLLGLGAAQSPGGRRNAHPPRIEVTA